MFKTIVSNYVKTEYFAVSIVSVHLARNIIVTNKAETFVTGCFVQEGTKTELSEALFSVFRVSIIRNEC